MTTHRGVYVALAVIFLVCGLANAEEEDKEHYPTSWANIDYKAVVDNDRLFKKYKECIISDSSNGCPRDILQLKKLIPEAIETLCAKCLPEHITKLKEAAEYICQKRRADYDEVRKLKDPTGEIQAKLEEKFGKINC